MQPGFSERTFEFCYNAEFCHLNAAILASHPYLPSQNEEKDLGYDVSFEINKGTYVKSLFLQHKVSYFAEHLAGRNAKFFNHHGGAYYRFPVDNDQHATLLALSHSKGDAFYCSPRFVGRRALEAHWRAQTIGKNSNTLDHRDVGPAGTGHHNITYGPSGEIPALHSQTRSFEKSYRGDLAGLPPLTKRVINNTYVRELCDQLSERATLRPAGRAVLKDVRQRQPLEIVQNLLARVYEVSWILIRDA